MPSTPSTLRPREHERSLYRKAKESGSVPGAHGLWCRKRRSTLDRCLTKDLCPRRSAIMVRANQNSPDSPAAGHRPSRLGNRCAGKTLPAWLRSRVRSRLAAPSAGIARAAGGRGCPGAAWGSQRRGPLGHVFMGRHATPDTARPECSDSRHDLRADVTSPQASAARRGIPFEPDRG
jgi:hypothetical protein